MPWYSQSTKFRKMVFIFMIQIQKPLEIKCFKVLKVNMEFILNVYQKSRSLLDLMLLKLKR